MTIFTLTGDKTNTQTARKNRILFTLKYIYFFDLRKRGVFYHKQINQST